MLKDCPSAVCGVLCLHLGCEFLSRIEAGVLVDEQGERRGKRRLGWRINEVNDPSAYARRAVCNEQGGRRILCGLRCVCRSCPSPGAFLELSSHCSCLGPCFPLPLEHMLPLPCPLCLQFLVTGLEILGPLMLEWHFGLAGIVYKHRALMLSPKPLESWEGLFFMWCFWRMLWEKVKGQSGNE